MAQSQSVDHNWINKLVESGGWKQGLTYRYYCGVTFFKNDDNEGSENTAEGVVVSVNKGFARICFDNDVLQNTVPIGWILQLTKSVGKGDLVTLYFKDEDNKRSSSSYTGAVTELRKDGNVQIRFINDVEDIVPAYWVTKSQSFRAGDRINCRFRSDSGENDQDSECDGTIVNIPNNSTTMNILFDNGSLQNRIPLAWTWEIVNLSAWTSGVAPGSIVSAHFKDDADERSSNHLFSTFPKNVQC